MENATRTPADMKSFRYCNRTKDAMRVMSPPAKRVPFLMFPVPSTTPNHGGIRPSHAKANVRRGWAMRATRAARGRKTSSPRLAAVLAHPTSRASKASGNPPTGLIRSYGSIPDNASVPAT